MAAESFFNAVRDTVTDKFVTTYKARPRALVDLRIPNERAPGRRWPDRRNARAFTFDGRELSGVRRRYARLGAAGATAST
jgi:hypothetical protein